MGPLAAHGGEARLQVRLRHNSGVDHTDLGVELNSSFVKDWPSFESEGSEAPKGGGDWALNVKVVIIK